MNKKLSDLIPDHANANKGTQRGRAALESSLRRYGAGRSILVDRNGRIIAGNKTAEVASDIGMDNVIVVQTDGTQIIAVQRTDLDIDSETGRGLAYADNRVGELSLDWDAEQVLADLDAGVNLSGLFDKEELDELLSGLKSNDDVADAEPQVDRAEELRQKWIVELGQLWQLGEHRLICGDCTDEAVVARVMGGEKADAVVTDPPYGQNQVGVTNDEPEKLAGIISGCVAILPCDNAIIVAFSSPRTFPVWLDAVRACGHKFERMLWMYKVAQETFPWRGWLLKSEAIVISSVGDGQWQDVHPYSHDCYYKSEVSGQLAPDSGWHGSVKPLDVVADLISRVSADGQIVYEPFSGSGTTLIACEALGRRCRAVELNPAYVAVALERWHVATGKMPARL